LMDFCRSTPKDTLFAGFPRAIDDIPLLTQRSVLASHECTLPHFLGYYEIMYARLQDQMRLLYATSWGEALALAAKHGVDYVIVPRRLVDPDRHYYMPPVREFEKQLRARAIAEGAALLAPPPERIALETDKFVVVDVRPAEQLGGGLQRPGTVVTPSAPSETATGVSPPDSTP